MSVRATAVRLAVFFGVLVLTLLPGLIGLTLFAGAGGIAWLLEPAWLWQIMATLPVGIARVPFDGEIYFANSSGFVALVFWVLVGLVTSVALRRLRLRHFAAVACAVILASGLAAHLLLAAFGYAMYMAP